MPLHLVPPGTRKGNRFYLVRGKVDGRDIEVSAKTTDADSARRFALELELKLLDCRVPEAGEDVTFAKAAELYSAWRSPGAEDVKRISRIKVVLGKKLVSKIQHADLVDAAMQIHPKAMASTRNRETLRPAAAIMHYAAKNNWCGWLRVELFKEKRPETRAVGKDVAHLLLANTEGDKHLLLLWLFRQGPRITDALQVECAKIDLTERVVTWRIGKTDREVTDPLHDDVWQILANRGGLDDEFLFPWATKSGVYKWLRPLCTKLGVKFTPHMARHSIGKWMNETGAKLRTIMDTLHHADPKSSIRYQSTDHDALREASRRVGKLVGK